MTQRTRLAVAVVVLLVSAFSAHAMDPDNCRNQRPNVVRLGIPRERQSSPTTDRAVAALRSVYRDPCGTRPLEIQLAYGSDYQMLDWLDSDLVDAAVTTDLALHVTGDARQLAEFLAPLGEALPLFPRIAFAATRTSDGWSRPTLHENEYLRFLDEVWRLKEGQRPATTRLALASHLSTTGFLVPLQIAAEHFERKLRDVSAITRAEKRELVWRNFFAATRFTLDCKTFDECLAVVARDREPLPDGVTILFYPGEEVLEKEALPAGRDGVGERLVMSESTAHELFAGVSTRGAHFAPMGPVPVGDALEAALDEPPHALRHLVEPEPLYGTRIYGFTADESLRLLRQQQRRSDEDQLALVLPGGGVKAAYQTGIIEALYRDRKLWNDTREESENGALAVRTVIGTSGGALLGFFVSQLTREEKVDLENVLWRKSPTQTLGTHDVFGFTDLPQYVSVGVAFLIFCTLLALFTGAGGLGSYPRGPIERPSWRRRLAPMAVLFIIAPLFVRKVIGGNEIEDVPVIEGMFYSIMGLLVMFADQCLVDRGAANGGKHAPRPVRSVAIFFAVSGAAMVAIALSGTSASDRLQQPLTFGFAFAVLSAMFIGGPMLLLQLTHRAGNRQRHLFETLLALVFVIGVLWAFGMRTSRFAQIAAFASLVCLAIATYLYTRFSKQRVWVPPLLTTATIYATALLCWPRDLEPEPFSFTFVTADSLHLSLGAFLTSVGFVLLLVGAATWAARDTRFVVDDVPPFFVALMVTLLHVGATLVAVNAAAAFSNGRVHALEMTPSFWIVLVVAAILLALVILGLARRVEFFQRAIKFLADEHRNGTLVPRRYARMLAVTSLGVLWWNFIIAPAIYGNRQATTYIARTIERFHAQRSVKSFAPSARFIVTANLLERDGTNYFMFHPESEPREASSAKQDGVQWRIYPTTRHHTARSCSAVIGPRCGDFVRDVVIASGSPFPIFAAHKVNIPAGEEEWFVDGGYSNNIPVDAAKTAEARQVLIVHSANPLDGGTHDETPSWIDWKPGRLVMNAKRLPGFLFERSQQADRLSRQNLFVVALAPPLEDARDWPNLAQFDETTVDNLLTKSKQHLDDRIGIVESWGQPRFETLREVVRRSSR